MIILAHVLVVIAIAYSIFSLVERVLREVRFYKVRKHYRSLEASEGWDDGDLYDDYYSIPFKKIRQEAVIPAKQNPGDAGFDLTAISKLEVRTGYFGGYTEYGTGISVAIPEGYTGFIFPRSSISNTQMMLANSVGVIDSNYRGEIKVRFKVDQSLGAPVVYNEGDRVAQLVILATHDFVLKEVNELDDTERGSGGFGSTGV